MDKKVALPLPKFLLESPNIKSDNNAPIKSAAKSVLMPGLIGSGICIKNPTAVENENKTDFKFKSPFQKHQQFNKSRHAAHLPHFSSPQGMLLPRHMQTPPMYGPRGPTIPPKYIKKSHSNNDQNHHENWCENCEKDFLSPTELKNHKLEHKTCGINGCTFEALDSTLQNHIEISHTSGLYDKVRKYSTPEEIAQWREERRKRYPTIRNVQLRQKAQEERMKRGEKLGPKKSRFGSKKDRRQIRSDPPKREKIVLRRPVEKRKLTEKKQKVNKRVKIEEKIKEITSEVVKYEDENEDLDLGQRFKGTSNLIDYIRPKLEVKKSRSLESNPIFNLVGMYGSSDDEYSDEDSTETEKDSLCIENNYNDDEHKICEINSSTSESTSRIEPITKTSKEEITSKLENLSENCNLSNKENFTNSDDEMPEEIPIVKETKFPEVFQQETVAEKPQETDNSNPTEQNNNKFTKGSRKLRKQFKNKRKEHKSADISLEGSNPKKCLLDYSKLKRRRQNTMLEKLLEPEIIHERNVLLQCVRFVVENNFFGIGNNNKG